MLLLYYNKFQVIDVVLKTMRKESTSLTHCGEVCSRLCLELPRMPVEELVRWSSDSVQSIVDDSDVNMMLVCLYISTVLSGVCDHPLCL